ncbi:MAG TPA: DNA translocase FtsK [Bdellovibrionota bacterium]|nr:DNA translocase FtsK [Bdellovibrionota bacterium]
MSLLKKIETPFQEAVLLIFLGFTAWLMFGGISFFLNTTPSTFIYFGDLGYRFISRAASFFGFAYFLFPIAVYKLGTLIIAKSTSFSDLLTIWKRVFSIVLASAGLAVAAAILLHVFAVHLQWSPEAKLADGYGGFLGLHIGGTLYAQFGFGGALLAAVSGLSLVAIFTGGFSIIAFLSSIGEESVHIAQIAKRVLVYTYRHVSAFVMNTVNLFSNKPLESPAEEIQLADDIALAHREHIADERASIQNSWNQVIRYANADTVFDARVPSAEELQLPRVKAPKPRPMKVIESPSAPLESIAAESAEVSAPTQSAEISLSPVPDPAITLTIEPWKKAYNKPPTSLLKLSKKAPVISATAKKEQAQILEKCLAGFGLDGKVVAVHNGVRLSMFEFEPAIGVKVSKIQALSNDLALSLGANSLRILAPIPGKNTVGIEMPSKQPSALSLGDLMEATQKNKKAVLPFALGKDVYGDVLVEDLSAMPHLLVSGTTGSGKSVFTNGLISSLLFNMSPRDLRFIMIDPKMIELTPYNGIPHLLKPVISDVDEAKQALVWAEKEMDRRYQMFLDVGARNIDSFNQKIKDISPKALAKKLGKDPSYSLDHMPYIVIVIDELADLMITQGKEVERPITRIAQKARACGIHMVLATQRPSAEIVTGLIKTNFPSRIAFKVSSSIDSRTILDVSGGEKLLGQGDMLYLPNGRNIIRVQGAYLSEDEVSRLVKYVKED